MDSAKNYASKAKDFVGDKTKDMIPAMSADFSKGDHGKVTEKAFRETSDFLRPEEMSREYML
jgi:hypothetical protein